MKNQIKNKNNATFFGLSSLFPPLQQTFLSHFHSIAYSSIFKLFKLCYFKNLKESRSTSPIVDFLLILCKLREGKEQEQGVSVEWDKRFANSSILSLATPRCGYMLTQRRKQPFCLLFLLIWGLLSQTVTFCS